MELFSKGGDASKMPQWDPIPEIESARSRSSPARHSSSQEREALQDRVLVRKRDSWVIYLFNQFIGPQVSLRLI